MWNLTMDSLHQCISLLSSPKEENGYELEEGGGMDEVLVDPGLCHCCHVNNRGIVEKYFSVIR